MIAAWLMGVCLAVPASLPDDNCSPLQEAAWAGDAAKIRQLVGRRLMGLTGVAPELDAHAAKSGACANRTALMVAAEYGQAEAVRELLASGANPNLTAVLAQFGDQPFDARCLALAGAQDGVAMLLEAAGAPGLQCASSARLFAAVRLVDLALLQRQLRAHPSGPTLRQALVQLAGSSRSSLAQPLAEAGVKLGVDLAAAYQAAIEADDRQLVDQLWASGARLTGGGELARAISLGRTTMIAPLIAAGARTDLGAVHDAIFEAISSSAGPTMQALLDAGWRGDDDIPAVLWAMRSFPAFVVPMIDAGVGVEVDDALGSTPLIYACTTSRGDWVTWLIGRGASPLTSDVTCRTAAQAARSAGHPEYLSLFKSGAPVPGRAAQRLHVNCGAAILKLKAAADVDVFLDGSSQSLSAATEYHVEPGPHVLRLGRAGERKMARRDLMLKAGLNEVSADDARHPPTRALLVTAEAIFPPEDGAPDTPASEILAVVDYHKAQVANCVAEQRKREPERTGELVMRWIIWPTGRSKDVSCETEEFRGGLLARCLGAEIERWTFPHGTSGAPVRFPFKF